ncbi:MAG: sigma-70 family RNA polymerase sigma factor [Planctomycetia bacterium]|nr:sigma-70 family RNA polymerase sigma factor [Planctomycetia bacterium]
MISAQAADRRKKFAVAARPWVHCCCVKSPRSGFFGRLDMIDTSASAAAGSTSSTLIARLKLRDAESWRRFAALYAPLVYRWSRQSGLQASDAADVVQEVFRSVAGQIDGFQHGGPQHTFRGWLWTITRNAVRQHFRRSASRPQAAGGSAALEHMQGIPDQEAPSSEAASEVPSGIQSDLVHRAIEIIRGDFEERTWQAFWRTAVDGQPAPQVADELDMTPRAVRQAKYRVLARLREMLAED